MPKIESTLSYNPNFPNIYDNIDFSNDTKVFDIVKTQILYGVKYNRFSDGHNCDWLIRVYKQMPHKQKILRHCFEQCLLITDTTLVFGVLYLIQMLGTNILPINKAKILTHILTLPNSKNEFGEFLHQKAVKLIS